MKKYLLTVMIMFSVALKSVAQDHPNLSANDALKKLQAGNNRFVEMKMNHPDESIDRRHEISSAQHPFAAVLSCSDSRVPTEIVFDQGLGDLFVIRNAGNVLDEHVLGSIEYAVEHLGVNLVVVLGHESCGAVGAAMSSDKDTRAIESLKKMIMPAIIACKKCNKYTYENVVKTHSCLEVEKIKQDEYLSDYMKKHNVKIISAYYHLDSGKVEFLN